jgi:hypothetical protein
MGSDQAFQARLRDRRANGIALILAVLFVTIVGINLLPFDDGSRKSIVAVPSLSTATSPPSLPATATHPPSRERVVTRIPRAGRPIDPGRYYMAWDELRVRLAIPAGWSSTGRGMTITNSTREGSMTITLSANSPRWVADSPALVVRDVCPRGSQTSYVEVGPTADDLSTALLQQVGIARTGPVDMTLSGFPARRFDLTDLRCTSGGGGPEGRVIWHNADRSESFGLLFGGTATIYVVDVNGDRLVISSQQRGASEAAVAEAASIIASIQIEPALSPVRWPQGDLPIGTHRWAVDGIPLWVGVPSSGWEPRDGVSLNKDVQGSQGAEAVVYWTRYPDGSLYPCLDVLGPGGGPSAADLAAVMAAAPGTELVAGPSAVTVGGHPATRIELRVREDLGCDPGFFFGWDELRGGAFWGHATPEQVQVWIVEVGAASVIIGSVASRDASPGLLQDIRDIVDSIRFE